MPPAESTATDAGDCEFNGCINPNACNYDDSANTDDGSCEHPLQYEDKIVVRFGDKTEYGDSLWILNKNEFELDLSQTIYELAHLSRPPHQVHENENDCDPKMLGYTSNDSREESEELTDPCWDALKNLK